MKTTIIYLAIFVFGCFQITAQKRPLSQLLSELEKNHSGAISDVFNQEEVQLLQQHFSKKRVSTPQKSLNTEFLATENQSNQFGHFNQNSPQTFNFIAPSGAADFEGAAVNDPANPGSVFLIDNAGNAYYIDTTTGAYLSLGIVNAPAGESFTGLEYNPDTGDMYGISTDGAGSSTLSLIDPGTLQVTVIGDTGLVLPIAIAFNILGNCFIQDIDTDILYRINLVTAAAVALGSIGFDADFGQGMALGQDGNIYMSAFNADSFQSELRSVNTDTGMTTLVAPIGSDSPGGLLQFAWMSGDFDPTTLSVSETDFNGFTMYPNPVSDRLFIKSKSEIERYSIYDVTGKLLTTQNFSSNIDVSNLEVGVYLLRMETIDGYSSTKKFTKK
ncbi:T9SS type A sorting domain-containing protein [Patiriisocius hiemis]|uniref:T9SS type A sorting domain-containing protein n=1 Tax=Patiriisocius hiemis TaxID=3075604 RepID=A0ABU2YHH8_9FLAO|nr:T9SS type A sorting domain-containing protein [Constantimarinum sp. W242]MDT0556528.1 T9SS type A sorting domain-containing protein [Constantimarinum sp. W242]